MENPQEVPLGENKYSQDLEEYGLVPTDKQIKIITTEIDKAIEREHPLQLLHTNSHLGDHYIIRSALEVVLAEYCRTKGINKTANISLSHTPIKGAIDLPRLTSAFGNHFLSYQGVINNIYHSYILWLANHLGVEVTQDMLSTPPLPFRCDYNRTPMENFDWIKVNQYAETIRSGLDKDRGYCILVHAGSKPNKRFDVAQVRDMKVTFKTLFPRSGFIIISAQGVDGVRRDRLGDSDADLFIEAEGDINLTAAAFLAPSRITTISTDTFLAWLSGGMIASRPDRPGHRLNDKDLFVFNTVASSEFWNIPGANHFEGVAIQRLRENGRFKGSADSLMSDQDYYENTQFGRNAMFGTTAGISPIDIAAYTRFVVAQNSANPIF